VTIRVGYALGLVAAATLSCATTRYEEYGPPPDEPVAAETPENSAETPGDMTQPAQAAPVSDGPGLDKGVSDLEGKILSRLEQLESTEGTILARVAELSEEFRLLEAQLVRQSPEPSMPVKAAPSPELESTDVNRLYDDALQVFDKQKYSEASGFFGRIMVIDSRGPLADNAQYWIGECAYAVEDYTGALEAFKRVFQFAGTEKDDDAQLKLGYCYLRLGDSKSALIEYKRLTVDYPESEYLTRAEEQIRRIRAARASKP
jgi:TolA-binding protein